MEDTQTQQPRFAFGANWQAFLNTLTEERIQEAERSLREMLVVDNLQGQRILDIGSGSGLFSLAARRLGARVHAFDYDPQSVACTEALKRRYFPDDPDWCIEQGSVLDADYLQTLGRFDGVYAWGVLHHTGNLSQALDNAALPVKPGGWLFIAIYNDQGLASRLWQRIKRAYCAGPLSRWLLSAVFLPAFALLHVLVGMVKYRHPLGQFIHYKRRRGMSIHHDWIDWLGGYPFEVAKPEEIFQRYWQQGFTLENLRTTNRLGCNEFVFRQSRCASDAPTPPSANA